MEKEVTVEGLIDKIVRGITHYTDAELQLYVNESEKIEERLIEIYDTVD